jgi:hypothetical protein
MYTPGEYGPESGWKPPAAHPATPSSMAMQLTDCRGDSHGIQSMICSVPLASGIDELKTAFGLDRRSSPTAMLDIAIRHFHRVDLE